MPLEANSSLALVASPALHRRSAIGRQTQTARGRQGLALAVGPGGGAAAGGGGPQAAAHPRGRVVVSALPETGGRNRKAFGPGRIGPLDAGLSRCGPGGGRGRRTERHRHARPADPHDAGRSGGGARRVPFGRGPGELAQETIPGRVGSAEATRRCWPTTSPTRGRGAIDTAVPAAESGDPRGAGTSVNRVPVSGVLVTVISP